MALGLAVVAIVIGAGLAALLFFLAFEETKLGDSGSRLNQALGVGEEGALEVLRVWDPRVYNLHDPYPLDSDLVPAGYPTTWTASLHGTGSYGGRRYKLNGELYLIDVVGQAGSARQGIAVLAHVRSVVPGIRAALTVGKGTRWSGSVAIEARDQVPPGWDPCGPPDTGRASLLQDSTAQGVGAVGGFAYSDLASLATWSFPARSYIARVGPTAVDGRCDETVATNWGRGSAPYEVCGGYLPVVHMVGDATLGGGEGQGTLLVDGDLRLAGAFEWRGLVLVGRSLRVQGGPIAIWGGVLVRDSAVVDPGVAGSVAITYSKCSIVKALESVAPAVMLPSRGWIGLAEEP